MTSPEDLFDSYDRHYRRGFDSYFVDPELVKARRLSRLPCWMSEVSRDVRILDAGCADGYMLSVLLSEGFHNISGIDISSEMCAIARARLQPKVVIENVSISSFLSSCDNFYDVILFHHVIEHLPRDQTIDLLRSMRQRLVPGGVLAIRTPNANALAFGYHCRGDFTHVVAFNERSLLQVLEGAGFSPAEISIQVNPPELFFSFRYPVGMFLRVCNRLRWHFNRLLHRSVYLLGDLRPLPKSFDWELEVLAREQI